MIFGYLFSIIFSGWILSAHFLQKNLTIYTSDRYYMLILISAIAGMIIGLVGLYVSRKSIDTSNSYLVTLAATIIGGILFSPILLIFSIVLLAFPQFEMKLNWDIFFVGIIILSIIFPTKGISPALAEERADEINTVSVQDGVRILNNFAVSTEKYNIGDWAASIAYNSDPEFYKGKDVNVTGFVFKTNNQSADEFFIARYSIRCCVADAVPTGILVQYNIQNEFKIGDWIEIKGSFGVSKDEEIIIIPSEINSIEIPEKQYIF